MLNNVMEDLKNAIITEDFDRIMTQAVKDLAVQFSYHVRERTETVYHNEKINLDRGNIYINLVIATAFQIIKATALSVKDIDEPPMLKGQGYQAAKESVMAQIDLLIRDLDLTATLMRCK